MATEVEDPKTIEAPLDRKGAIAAAVAAADKEVEGEKKDETPVEKPEKKEEVAKPSEEDEELTKQGRELLLALKDPKRAGAVIQFLAEQAGYTKAPPETKAEVKEAKDEILDILKGELGDEFTFFSTKLGPALDKILDKKLTDIRAEVRQQAEAQQADKLRVESEKVTTKIGESFFGKGEVIPDNVIDEMSKFMEKVPPTKDTTLQEYVETAFYASVGKLGITKDSVKKQQKTERNRNDAPSRLASERGPSPDAIRQDTSKSMSRQEAIAAAVASLKEK